MVDTDPRMELADLLADVAAYAAWLQICGAEILPVEAVTRPEAEAPRFTPPQAHREPQPPPGRSARPAEPPPRSAPEPPPRPSPRPAARRVPEELPSTWASIISAPKVEPIGAEALALLAGQLSPDQPCPACGNRIQLGRGEPTAAVAILSGETLVPQGREMLSGMLTRVLLIHPREVFFMSVNRCATHHRALPEDGTMTCAAVLAGQLSAVRPRLLLALGRDASRVLFSPQRVQIRRGHWSDYAKKHGPLPTLMTFHPNFLLQHPSNKGLAFTDLKEFRARMDTL